MNGGDASWWRIRGAFARATTASILVLLALAATARPALGHAHLKGAEPAEVDLDHATVSVCLDQDRVSVDALLAAIEAAGDEGHHYAGALIVPGSEISAGA